MLAQTVQMWALREVGLDVQILGFEDDLVAGGVKEDFSSVAAGDLEFEGVGLVVEIEFRVVGRAPLAMTWARKDVVRDLVDFFVGIVDFDMQPVRGLVFDFEAEIVEIVAEDIAGFAGEGEVDDEG